MPPPDTRIPGDRRSGKDRRAGADRRDRYQTVVQRVGLAGGSIAVIYGQAEMLGEPWRHIITVSAVAGLVALAIWMKQT